MSARYQENWIGFNCYIDLPTPDSHPNFPLWRLGYSAEEVFDAFFPAHFHFLCNPDRAAAMGRIVVPGEPPKDRLWRMDTALLDGEEVSEISKPERVRELVMPYFRHPGQRYG